MPVWLELVVNVAGYAGFLALAARGDARHQDLVRQPGVQRARSASPAERTGRSAFRRT